MGVVGESLCLCLLEPAPGFHGRLYLQKCEVLYSNVLLQLYSCYLSDYSRVQETVDGLLLPRVVRLSLYNVTYITVTEP